MHYRALHRRRRRNIFAYRGFRAPCLPRSDSRQPMVFNLPTYQPAGNTEFVCEVVHIVVVYHSPASQAAVHGIGWG